MTDLLSELKEDLWQERINRFLQRYWRGIILIIILAILLMALVQWNHSRLEVQKEKSGDLYNTAMVNLDEGSETASAQLDALTKAASHGYKELAQLQLAALYHKRGKPDDALSIYLSLKDKGSDILFRDTGALLAGKIYMQKNDYLNAITTLEPAAKKSHPWHFSALELIALSELELGNMDKARTALEEIRDSEKAPPSLQQRALALLSQLSRANEAAGKTQ